jgi:putative sigma-54 modulation protein
LLSRLAALLEISDRFATRKFCDGALVEVHMQLIITGKNIHVSNSLRTYTEKKIGKLDHYLPSLTDARVVFAKEKTKNESQAHLVQVTLHSNGSVIRGEQRSDDFSAAVDAVLEKLQKEIDHWKGKHYHNRGKSERALTRIDEPARAPLEVVRRKRFATPPMTEKQAIKAMNQLGHEFYLFLNKATDTLNVIYRRDDGNYGLIEPEPED